MIIILRRITADTKEQDIKDFLKPALQGGMLQIPGRIDIIKIVELKDEQANTKEYHGIVVIDSDSAAQRVLNTLSKKILKGKSIFIQEYNHRSWLNDPRIRVADLDEEILNKRKGDRRRSNLGENVDTSGNFSGVKDVQ